MPCGKTYIIQIIVLPAGPDTFLRTGSSFIRDVSLTGEDVFKLIHPGIGKKKSRVVMRNNR